MIAICNAGTAIVNDAAYIRIEYTEALDTWTSWDIVVESELGGVTGLVLTGSIWAGDTTNRTIEARAATNDLSDLGAYKAWGRITDAGGSFHTTSIQFQVEPLEF